VVRIPALGKGRTGHANCVHCSNPISEAVVSSMSVTTLVLIVLLLAAVGVLPAWSYSARWGYAPSGILAVLIVVLLLLFLMGRI
jgi:hypothetical protein